jgi:hypothetical protein
MNWIQIATIVLSAIPLVGFGLTIKWSRDARRYNEQARRSRARAAASRAETARLRAERINASR